MTGQSKKLKIGLFVIASVCLVVAVVVWLGASRFFEDSRICVAYFRESVQGLEKDSPVKFRGVSVGRVRDIRLSPDGRLIEIVLGLNRNFKITDDLGIKISLLGITGLKYLEMDTYPPEQVREAITFDFQPKYPVIATYPSDIKELGSALDNLFQKARTVDVERISHHLLSVAARMDKFLADGKLDKIATEASDTLKEIRETSKRLNDDLARQQPVRQLNRTLDKASAFIDQSSETVRNTDRMIRMTDNNLKGLAQKLDRAADNLVDFTRMIRQKPSTIFFGPDKDAGQKK